MKLLDEITEITGRTLAARSVIRPDWPLVQNERASTVICIELIAQAVDALDKFERNPAGPPSIGLLVGVKDSVLEQAEMPVGAEVRTNVEKVSGLGSYGVFSGRVSLEGVAVASAELQVFRPSSDELAALLRGGGLE
jgi:predicted hotdog family 3-hydroxylacyl-ACP dehydratase